MMKPKEPKLPALVLRWSREPNETGLRRVGQGERGWDLKHGKERIAYVRPRYVGWGREKAGYFFVSRHDGLSVPLENSCESAVATAMDAVEAAEEYVRKALGGRYRVSFRRTPVMPEAAPKGGG